MTWRRLMPTGVAASWTAAVGIELSSPGFEGIAVAAGTVLFVLGAVLLGAWLVMIATHGDPPKDGE